MRQKHVSFPTNNEELFKVKKVAQHFFVGKTSVKNMLAAVLAEEGETLATAGNFKVGQFALTEFVEGQPVNISVGVTGMDSDDIDQAGDDSVTGTIDVTVQAANDNLIDASSDPLTGTSEDDIFIISINIE